VAYFNDENGNGNGSGKVAGLFGIPTPLAVLGSPRIQFAPTALLRGHF
jgi:hypothetical protein